VTFEGTGQLFPAKICRRLLWVGAAGSGLVAVGVTRNRYRQTACQLFDLEVDAEIVEVHRRLDEATRRRRGHDIVNAFTAVEGAAIIMAREALTPSDRSTLAAVLGSGLGHLRSLLAAAPEIERAALADVAAQVVHDQRCADRVRIDVAPDLVVPGAAGETAEVLRRLIVHAAGRSPSGLITVRAGRLGHRIDLWVDDRGPRLTPRQRREILQPGHRPRSGSTRRREQRSAPHPMDVLPVAIRLARGRGGDFRVVARVGGGESFGISWPVLVG